MGQAMILVGPKLALAKELRDKDRIRQSNALLRLCANLLPESDEVAMQLAEHLRDAHMASEALKVLEDLHERAPNPLHAISLGYGRLSNGLPDEAIDAFEEALGENGDHEAEALAGLARVHFNRDDIDTATTYHERALSLKPDLRSILFQSLNLAAWRGDADGLERAADILNNGDYDVEATRWVIGTGRLILGQYEAGWKDYSYRKLPRMPVAVRGVPQPWRWSDLPGKRVLLIDEQGIGDGVQYYRFAGRLVREGAEVHIRASSMRHHLIRCVSPEIAATEKVFKDIGYDYVVSLDNMACLLAAEGETRLDFGPYLVPDPANVRKWAPLVPGDRLNVGLVWQGSKGNELDIGRSMPVAALEPLLGIDGIRFVCLHRAKAVEDEERKRYGDRILFPEHLDDGKESFADTTGLIASLDVVVSTDTSAAHIAGAMGKETLLMLKQYPEWRWLMGRDQCDWYGSITRLRQERPGDWPGVVARVAERLIELRDAR